MQLPTVSGYNLKRQAKTFPADFQGQVNLVFIAFKRWHQAHVDSWVPYITELCTQFPTLQYLEFPTLPESGFLYRLFLNEGMRAGIPSPDTRTRTVTLYLNKQAFRQALDIPHEESMWVYLFDKQGKSLGRVEGAFTPEQAGRLKSVIDTHLVSVLPVVAVSGH